MTLYNLPYLAHSEDILVDAKSIMFQYDRVLQPNTAQWTQTGRNSDHYFKENNLESLKPKNTKFLFLVNFINLIHKTTNV